MKTNLSIRPSRLLGIALLVSACLVPEASNAATNGAPVSVIAIVLQQNTRVGEPLPVKLEIRNTGDRPVDPGIMYPLLFGQFHAPGLHTIEGPVVGPSSIRRPVEPVMPGESRSWTVVLNRYLRLDAPGTYATTYSGEIYVLRDAASGIIDRATHANSDKFEITIAPGPARRDVLERIARQLDSADPTTAALGYDMLLHAEIDGALDLLTKYAGDTRFKRFRRDAIGRLARFLPDARAANAIVSIPPINDSRLMLVAIQAFENAGQHFPEKDLKRWYAQSNDMTKESMLALFTQWKLSDYARIVRHDE